MENFEYPEVLDPEMVGEYPGLASAGAGFFYDEVLEYRIWCYPHKGTEIPENDDYSDYYYAFESFESADAFYEQNRELKGAQEPIVLIRQLEWLNESEPGKYTHEKGERIAEWPASSLKGRKRQSDSISNFFKDKER